MDGREFQLFGVSHWLAIGATVLCGCLLVPWFRNPSVGQEHKLRARRILAAILGAAVVLDPILAWLRYADTPDFAWRMVLENALPLFLCDVASLLLVWALLSGRQRLAEVGYFWALAGTTQGLITPTLPFDWDSPEYYAFFAQHGGAPVAAAVLAFGVGLAPAKGYFLRMVCWSWGYMAVVMGFNALLGLNYGFLNGKPTTPSLLDRMGPWPYYLISLQVAAFSLYLALGWLAAFLSAKFPLPGMRSDRVP